MTTYNSDIPNSLARVVIEGPPADDPGCGVSIVASDPRLAAHASCVISLADFHAAAFKVLGPGVVQAPKPATPDEVKPGQVWGKPGGVEAHIHRVHANSAVYSYVLDDGRMFASIWMRDAILANWTFLREAVTS